MSWAPRQFRVSGALDSHYSPKAQVVINAMAERGEGFIAPATITTPNGAIRDRITKAAHGD